MRRSRQSNSTFKIYNCNFVAIINPVSFHRNIDSSDKKLMTDSLKLTSNKKDSRDSWRQ